MRRHGLWRRCGAVAVVTAALVVTGLGTANASARPATLGAARAALAGRLVPGSAVGIDSATHHVVLTISDSAKKAAGLLSAARGLGSMVRVQRVRGTFGPLDGHFQGGNGIVDFNDGVICTLGFNTTGGFALTAGHCAAFRGPWYKEDNGLLIGPAIDSQFPGTDFGLIRNKGTMAQRGAIQGYDAGVIPVTGAGNAAIGEPVCKSGRTTERTCGSVTALNVTVTYSTGQTVYGLIQTSVCAEPGDSGGPLYDGGTALGLTSGGSGNCTVGGTTFFQPVIPALNFYGVSLLTS